MRVAQPTAKKFCIARQSFELAVLHSPRSPIKLLLATDYANRCLTKRLRHSFRLRGALPPSTLWVEEQPFTYNPSTILACYRPSNRG